MSATMMMLCQEASSTRSNMCPSVATVSFMVAFLRQFSVEHGAKGFHIIGRERFVFDEVRQHRHGLAAEAALQERISSLAYAGRFRNDGGEAIGSVPFFPSDDLLL